MKFETAIKESHGEIILEADIHQLLNDKKQWEFTRKSIKDAVTKKHNVNVIMSRLINAWDIKSEKQLDDIISDLELKYGGNDPINKLIINQIKVSAQPYIEKAKKDAIVDRKKSLDIQAKTKKELGRKDILPIVGK